MAEVDGMGEFNKNIDSLINEAGPDQVFVRVGYNAGYAVPVHENVEMKWRGLPRKSGLGVYWGPRGQAKFLEAPFRLMYFDLYDAIRRVYEKTKSVTDALMYAGLMLQRRSQEMVPVEYDNLRPSAFTEVEQ